MKKLKISNSIKSNIIIWFIVFGVQISQFLIAFFISNLNNIIIDRQEGQLTNLNSYNTQEVNNFIDSNIDLLNNLEYHIKGFIEHESDFNLYTDIIPNLEKSEKYFKSILKYNKEIVSIYLYSIPQVSNEIVLNYEVLNSNGQQQVNIFDTIEYGDINDQDWQWFYGPLHNDSIYISEPYFWQDYNKNLISFTKPLKINNETIQIIGIDFSFEYILKIIKDIKIFDTGYQYVLNKEGTTLIHPNDEMIGKDIKKINDSLYEMVTTINRNIENGKTEGLYEYFYNGEDKITSYKQLNNGWVFYIGQTVNEYMKERNEITKISLIILFTSIVIVLLFQIFLGNKIQNPLIKVTSIIKKLGDGDLTESISYKGKFQELLDIKNSLNNMIDNLKDNLNGVKHNSNELNNTSEKLNEKSKQDLITISKFYEYVDDVEKQVSDISQTIEETTSGIEEISSSQQSMTEQLIEIERNLTNTNTKLNNSNENVKKEMDLIEDMTNKNKENVQKQEELIKKSNSLNEITEKISGIQEQTNLLQLNQAIEQQRAGESGKGFAVVQDEIRKLQEQSEQMTSQIQTTLKSVIEDIKDINTHIGESNDTFINISEISGTLQVSLNEQDEQFNLLKEIQDNLSTGVEQQTQQIEEITSQMSEQSTSVYSITEQMGEISEGVGKQKESIEQLTEIQNNLNNYQESLEIGLSKYTIE